MEIFASIVWALYLVCGVLLIDAIAPPLMRAIFRKKP